MISTKTPRLNQIAKGNNFFKLLIYKIKLLIFACSRPAKKQHFVYTRLSAGKPTFSTDFYFDLPAGFLTKYLFDFAVYHYLLYLREII